MGTKLQRSQERAIYSLASQCAQLQLRSGGSDATLSWGGDAYMLTEDGTEDMDTSQQEDPGAPKPQLDTATTADTAASPSAVDVAWGRLRARLEGYERGDAHGYRLRLVAIEAVLKLDLALSPPRWLLAPFVPPPVEGLLASLTAAPQLSADVAALVRLYMRYDRMEDAAVLAVRFISVVADSVPSMVLSRPASVCLPHALFDELAAQLPQTLALRQKLVDKLAAARTAATSQTGILEKNYA